MGTFKALQPVMTVALAITAFLVAPAAADVSFEGKTIQMGIGSSPGGGTDRAARLAAQFLEKYLPGNPSVVVKNFGAGGGKIRAANYLALEAPKDGTFVLGLDTSPIRPSTVLRDVARYDPRKFHPVGGVNRGGSVILIRQDAHPRLEDAASKPVIVGAISGTRTWQTMLLMGKEYLGWNLKWVPGYKGTSSMVKALRQGEIDVLATNNAYIIDEMVKDGVVDLLAQEGQVAGTGYKPRTTFPDVPLFPEMLAPVLRTDAHGMGVIVGLAWSQQGDLLALRGDDHAALECYGRANAVLGQHPNERSEALNQRLIYGVYETTQEFFVRVIERQTNRQIKVIPPEDFLEMRARLQETVGALLDEEI